MGTKLLQWDEGSKALKASMWRTELWSLSCVGHEDERSEVSTHIHNRRQKDS